MPTAEDEFAPYTSPINVLGVIERMRKYNLPDPLNVQALTTVGVPEKTATRVQQALKFLNLIDEEMRITPVFRTLGKATTDEYHELLSQIIKTAYAHVFTITDPAEAGDEELENAFRRYEPRAQSRRMITLFLALCREAELVTADRTLARSRNTAPNTRTVVVVKRKPAAPSTNPKLPLDGDGAETPLPLFKPDNEETHRPSVNARSVSLASGGKVTLSINIDLFDLSESDRNFVMSLIDAIKNYKVNNNENQGVLAEDSP